LADGAFVRTAKNGETGLHTLVSEKKIVCLWTQDWGGVAFFSILQQ
jgi:hypothetical protein